MPMVESALNNREINVPPRLPIILKQFCKAAIRTQPYDLLKWSSAYFRALAEGVEPPTKIRLEHPLPQTISGLTLGFLKVLLRQLGDYNKTLSIDAILRRWDDLCLDRRELNLIMIVGKFRRKCQVKKFLAIAVGLLGSSLFETMLLICELFTLEPDGGSAMIPVTLFMEIYGYLAGLRCDGTKRESFEEDPSEFLIFEPTESHPPSTEMRSSDRDSSTVPAVEHVSLTSQDTEADVNVDLESSSKDESQSDVKPSPEVPRKNSTGTGSTSTETEQRQSLKTNSQNSGDMTVEPVESSPTLSKDLGSEKSSPKSENRESSKELDDSFNQVTTTSNDYEKSVILDEKINSDNARKKIQMDDNVLMTYYPNIPGIGARLLPEEVAAVAIWMAECGKLQEGMVGPRNLRHFNCPPLDRPDSSES